MRWNASPLRSTSSRKIAGSLPPSSSATRLRLSAAIPAMTLPARTLPVNEILLTSGSWIITGPRTSSVPLRTLMTPGGSSAAMISSVRTNDSGVVGGALTIVVLPATSA